MLRVGVLILALVATPALAGSHRVKAHFTKSGAFVASSRATNPNRTKLDNYSTKGNTNPWTGKSGTKDPFAPKRRPR